MNDHEGGRPPQDRSDDGAPHYSAKDARGGEIILRMRARRMIFIAGLVGFALLALLLRFAS